MPGLESLSPTVQGTIANMTEQQKLAFESEYNKKAKSVGPYVFLAIVCPIQFILLGKVALQIVFTLTLGGFFVWYIIEWFLTPKRVREYNETIATDIARNIKIMM